MKRDTLQCLLGGFAIAMWLAFAFMLGQQWHHQPSQHLVCWTEVNRQMPDGTEKMCAYVVTHK